MSDTAPKAKATSAVAFCFLLNQLLARETWARERLERFAGQSAEFRPPFLPPLRLAITAGGHIEPGPKAYDFRSWLAVSLPILLVESFYLLLSYTDVLVLQQFRSSEEVGVYFAVVKTLALVSFIHYAMAATTAHRFAEYHAQGDKPRLSAYVAHAIQWTFWPSLAATILLLALGMILLLVDRANLPLGRLPGDITYRGKNTVVFFPLTTSIILSVVLSIILYFIGRMRH